MAKNREDLKVNGYMKLPGGVFENVAINGGAELNSDLDCRDLKVNGMLTVNGNVKAGDGKIRGKAYVKGDFACEDISVAGKTEVTGGMTVKELKIEGSTEIEGSISAEKVSVFGELLAGEGCNAEEFESRGRFRVSGLLNADRIKCELYGKSYAGEIGGETIDIKGGRGFGFDNLIKYIFAPFNFNEGRLNAGIIEGDDICLEYTDAKIVRGGKVVIGEGCDIELVEYRDSFKQDRGSKVKENRKL
jgi:cytoskeletal protein CcmA (bactofilin family)